jgi:phosphoribosylformylglycinamidine synthase subunit PurQ / glutaminase
VLAEAGLVPGALLRNRGLRFLGRDVHIAAERLDTPFTHALAAAGQPLRMPIAHGEGCYFADDTALDRLEGERGVLFRYVTPDDGRAAESDREANPNGSLRAIAGVIAPGGNVAGLMPHPERAAEAILGSEDGAGIIRSLVESAARAEAGDRAVAVASR